MAGYVDERGVVNLAEVARAITSRLALVVGFSVFAAVATGVWVYQLPDQYRAELNLLPADGDSQGGLGGLVGQLGGIASLAGLSGATGSDTGNDAVAIDIIQTPAFIAELVDEQGLLPLLIAVEDWDKEAKKLVYDTAKYDPQSDSWLTDDGEVDPRPVPPWRGIGQFRKRFEVIRSQESTMITLAFEHESPEVSVNVLEGLYGKINEQMRLAAIKEAQSNIDYLKTQVEETAIADLRAVFYSLIEEQTKTLMLASSNVEFVFKKATPILLPEDKSSPARALIVIVISFLATALALMTAIVLGPKR